MPTFCEASRRVPQARPAAHVTSGMERWARKRDRWKCGAGSGAKQGDGARQSEGEKKKTDVLNDKLEIRQAGRESEQAR
eukprot:5759798-Pleurochrysis_carterae.AAC.1